MPHRLIRTIIENQAILAAPSTTTVADAARLMKQHKTGALLVCDNGRLIGVFTERDALFRVTAEECDPKNNSTCQRDDAKPTDSRRRQTARACPAHDVRRGVSQCAGRGERAADRLGLGAPRSRPRAQGVRIRDGSARRHCPDPIAQTLPDRDSSQRRHSHLGRVSSEALSTAQFGAQGDH